MHAPIGMGAEPTRERMRRTTRGLSTRAGSASWRNEPTLRKRSNSRARRSAVLPMDAVDHSEKPDRDVPLRDDVRHLGRILGDTVRAKEGEGAFELIENIR